MTDGESEGEIMKRNGRRKAVERRYLCNTEIRADEEGRLIWGHIVLFDSDSVDMGFVERVKPGAFRKTLKENSSIKALRNHDSNQILANTAAGTLRLKEDAKGLFAEIDPPDTSYARDLLVSIKRGDVPGSSFSFVPIVDQWTKGESGRPDERELIEVELREVSVGVVFPAYLEAIQIQARSLEVLEGAGIELDRLTDILDRSKNEGYEVTDEDAEIIQRSVAALQRHIPATRGEPSPQRRHSLERCNKARLDSLRLRLQGVNRYA